MNDICNANLAPGHIFIYSTGPIALSVCVPQAMTPGEIECQVNDEHPTGIDSAWTISKDTSFRTGETIPAVCNEDKARRHWLLNC